MFLNLSTRSLEKPSCFRPRKGNYVSKSREGKCERCGKTVFVPVRGIMFLNMSAEIEALKAESFRPRKGNYVSKYRLSVSS